MSDRLVKLVHAHDLAGWDRFLAYEEHVGKTLAQHRAEVKARKDLGSKLWRLVEANRLVDNADKLEVYNTETVLSPWPISLPGWRSADLPSPKHSGTIFEPEIGRVKGDRLVLPLFTKERLVKVSYLAPNRVSSADRVAEAEKQLACASETDREQLQIYLTTPEPEPVLLISHRWESTTHPDPDGRQIEKLKQLKDCYIIYDYASFPQD